MIVCCKECKQRYVGCHSKCIKYKSHKLCHDIMKKRNTPVLSQGKYLYNKRVEYSIRRSTKAMLLT